MAEHLQSRMQQRPTWAAAEPTEQVPSTDGALDLGRAEVSHAEVAVEIRVKALNCRREKLHLW